MIRILIADDHEVVRKGLRQVIEETSDLVVTGEASNGHEVLEKIRKNDHDLVVLDIGLPDISGLDVLKQVKIECPQLPVVILSIYPEEQYAVRALKAGASGYLTKESASDELITAIRKVYDGRKYVSTTLAERLAKELEAGADKLPHETLSDREYQVMRMIALGKTIKDISEEINLSPKTVSTYRSRIFEKMTIKTNEELIRYAIDNHLID